MKKPVAVWQFTDMKTGHKLGLRARTQKSAAAVLKARGYKFKDLKRYHGKIHDGPRRKTAASGYVAPAPKPSLWQKLKNLFNVNHH